MPKERKPPDFSPEQVREISYRVYLARLEPPLTPEQAATYNYYNDKTKKATTDADFRRNAVFYDSITRIYLRALMDLGMVKPE